MIHFTLPPRDQRRKGLFESVVAELGAPVTPAAYLKLRRRAAGLSVAQLAARIAPEVERSAEAVDLLYVLETPGCRARHRATIETIATVLPMDPDVYFQLADEPAERHPHVCRGCGCSAFDPCCGSRGVCGWTDTGLCSRCDGPAIDTGRR